MGDRTRIKYTEAEQLSFALCPETCPAIEAAFDKARAFDFPEAESILRSYGIEPNKNLLYALDHIVGKSIAPRLHDLREVVLYQGTFPLRLALVQKIEQELTAAGKPQQESNFARWLTERKAMRRPEQAG